jgi:hypothetical protein
MPKGKGKKKKKSSVKALAEHFEQMGMRSDKDKQFGFTKSDEQTTDMEEDEGTPVTRTPTTETDNEREEKDEHMSDGTDTSEHEAGEGEDKRKTKPKAKRAPRSRSLSTERGRKIQAVIDKQVQISLGPIMDQLAAIQQQLAATTRVESQPKSQPDSQAHSESSEEQRTSPPPPEPRLKSQIYKVDKSDRPRFTNQDGSQPGPSNNRRWETVPTADMRLKSSLQKQLDRLEQMEMELKSYELQERRQVEQMATKARVSLNKKRELLKLQRSRVSLLQSKLDGKVEDEELEAMEEGFRAEEAALEDEYYYEPEDQQVKKSHKHVHFHTDMVTSSSSDSDFDAQRKNKKQKVHTESHSESDTSTESSSDTNTDMSEGEDNIKNNIKPSIKISMPNIPIYSGATSDKIVTHPERWFEDLQRWSEWTHTNIFDSLKFHTNGMARQWVELNMQRLDPKKVLVKDTKHWPKLIKKVKQEFIRTFVPSLSKRQTKAKEYIIAGKLKQEPNETVQHFYIKFMTKLYEAEWRMDKKDQSDICLLFRKGLISKIRTKCTTTSSGKLFKSLPKLLSYAEAKESELEEQTDIDSEVRTENAVIAAARQQDNKQKDNNSDKHKKFNKKKFSKSQRSYQGFRGRDQARNSYNGGRNSYYGGRGGRGQGQKQSYYGGRGQQRDSYYGGRGQQKDSYYGGYQQRKDSYYGGYGRSQQHDHSYNEGSRQQSGYQPGYKPPMDPKEAKPGRNRVAAVLLDQWGKEQRPRGYDNTTTSARSFINRVQKKVRCVLCQDTGPDDTGAMKSHYATFCQKYREYFEEHPDEFDNPPIKE